MNGVGSMKFLYLVGGFLLASTGAHAGTLPNGTPVKQISASIFLMGAPAEPASEPVQQQAKAGKPVTVATLPTAQMSLDDIIGPRPEVMNKPRSLADLEVPASNRIAATSGSGSLATASSGNIPVPQSRPADIDEGMTAAVNAPRKPEFPGMELRRE